MYDIFYLLYLIKDAMIPVLSLVEFAFLSDKQIHSFFLLFSISFVYRILFFTFFPLTFAKITVCMRGKRKKYFLFFQARIFVIPFDYLTLAL